MNLVNLWDFSIQKKLGPRPSNHDFSIWHYDIAFSFIASSRHNRS